MMCVLLFLLFYIEIGADAKSSCLHGTTQTNGSCKCNTGFTGVACDQDIDECKLQYCNKEGYSSCQNNHGSYNCTCKIGWEGKRCEIDHDDCTPNPCLPYGHCKDRVGWYLCECLPGYVGKNCQYKCQDCKNNGTCELSRKTGQPFCNCPRGRTGELCDKNLDECKTISDLCNNGKCQDTIGSYRCICDEGWEGPHCKRKIDWCEKSASTPCNGHGLCLSHTTKFSCLCDENWQGEHCDACKDQWRGPNCTELIKPCDHSPCQHGGICHNNGSSNYTCECKKDYGGRNCEHNLPCLTAPCLHNATCVNERYPHDEYMYRCICKPGWRGDHCNETSPCKAGICKNGGKCNDNGDTYNCTCAAGYGGTNCEEKLCADSRCWVQAVNLSCRAECNNKECKYDNGTCTGGKGGVLNPWDQCAFPELCAKKFMNNVCDKQCDNEKCLNDGRDCHQEKKCSKEGHCKKLWNNGVCNSECNNEACGWDGMDCDTDKKTEKTADGSVTLQITASAEEFENFRSEFVRVMSMFLNTHIIIISVTEVTIDEPAFTRLRRAVSDLVRLRRAVANHRRRKRLDIKFILDNQKCFKDCFTSSRAAADFIAASKRSGKLPRNLPFRDNIKKISYDRSPSPTPPSPINPLWVVICVAVPLLLLGVIAFSRKVVARLWQPEGDNRYHNNDMRREPLGQEGDEMTNLQRRESVSGGSHVSPSGSCSDSPNSVGDAKRMKVDMHGSLGNGDNTWLNVKGVLREQTDNKDGVVHLPNFVCNDSDVQQADGLCGDTDGETNLHIAARLAKTDLARQLMEFGVDINARNKSGKTPLHLAVASLADGVFNLLIRNRACQIDVQDYEGRTALMSACHCCHNNMVDELISNSAKVNLVDGQGKTALHCAAMVDNHKAVLVLLKNGAKVDAQDSKGQTPLFLAARDGAYTTAYVLLANYANRNCADSMDVTPLAISHQRGQKDLVHLLSDWTGSPPGLMTSPSRNSPPDLSSPSSGSISPTPVSQYSDIRPKLPNNNFGPFTNSGGCTQAAKPPMNKRKRKSTKTTGPNQAPKEKQPATNIQVDKTHNHNHSTFLNNMNDIFPSPRSTMDKRDVCLPEACLGGGDMLDGLNPIYTPLEQISNLPSTWGPSIVGTVNGSSHGVYSHPGHHQYNNPMVSHMTRGHYQFAPVQTFASYEPPVHTSCGSMRSYPTPPTPVGMDSPNEVGSPLDQINVLPSPFLTPSPDTWSNSPGNSDNSG